MTVVVALCGCLRSGKDTAGAALCSAMQFTGMKFAAPLKQACQAAFGFSAEQVEGEQKDEVDPAWGIAPRQAMQWLGTEVFQYGVATLLPDIGRQIWVRRLVQSIRQAGVERVVVTDLRFPHEAIALKAEFPRCLVIRLERPGGCVASHASELDVVHVPADTIIINDGTVEELQGRVMDTVARWLLT